MEVSEVKHPARVQKRSKTSSEIVKKKEVEKGFFESLISILEKKQRKAQRQLGKNHRRALAWLKKQGLDLGSIKVQIAKLITTGTVTAVLIGVTAAPIAALSVPNIQPQESQTSTQSLTAKSDLFFQLQQIIDRWGQKPNPADASRLAQLVSQITNIPARTVLEGRQLNRVVGRIGLEQHLPRYPGDKIGVHLTDQEDQQKITRAGIAPRTGAWGYFANSRNQLTDDLVAKEKYYVVVQTFLLPEWGANWPEEKEWFKFRKVLVFNPQNGKSVVAVIADAGPASWTGKHFGGSPEVMENLNLSGGPNSGEVVMLFVDDPDDKIPLGPTGSGDFTLIAQKEVLEK